MPLPADETKVETAKSLLDTLHGLFGPHPGFRPAHAKGVLLEGTFKPTAKAAELSSAVHFNQPSTKVIARFSSGTGLPQLPDTDPNGNPRGLGLRFMLAEEPRRVHTDIVAHSIPFFPAATGEEALAFFRSVADGSVGDYVPKHPAAKAFVEAPKPTPSSFAREQFFGIHAFELVNTQGKGTFIRYQIVPDAGLDHLEDAAVKGKSDNFLFDEIKERVKSGPINFTIKAQVAQDGDVTDDNTKHWPEDREVVTLGSFSLTSAVEDTLAQQKHIILDPVPRVDGIKPSADPLIDVRAALYLISGRERRAA